MGSGCWQWREPRLQRRVASFGYQLATSQGFFLNGAEGAVECGVPQVAGAGPEISGSSLVLK